MNKRMLIMTGLMLTLAATLTVRTSAVVDTLSPDDFKLQSFSKTVDLFDFYRTHASLYNKAAPEDDWHAYLNLNYINASGFQLLYAGLVNITAGEGALTIPVQNFMEHYKTPNGEDVLTSSSFIMLLAFNDTSTSKYADSPDVNDNLYASFSLGFDLANITGSSKPALNSGATIIPLTTTDDKTWTWGMKYSNLTAIWWRMYTNSVNPRFDVLPIVITTYEELTFMYKLELDPTNHKATVTANYIIGRMTNLWLIHWLFIWPIVAHYNSTGTYLPNGAKIADTTVYQFLEQQHIKMSIVLFQNSLVVDKQTKSTFNNQNVTDAEIDVSNGAISTQVGNEDIFKTDFGSKKQYKLFNYTADSTETDYDTYDAVTRTVPRTGYAKNPLLWIQVYLLNYVPVIVKHIAPSLYQRATNFMLNMTYADYFYVTSYPKYSGFKVEHDPTYTAYIAAPATTGGTATIGPNLGGLVVIAVIVVAAVGTVVILRRRGMRARTSQPTAPTPPTPPSPPENTAT